MKKHKISVVVCTLNRPQILQKCLESLSKQVVNQRYFEVVIIDNGNNKQTKKIVDKYLEKHKNYLYYKEKVIGLSVARNTGFKKANYGYVAYIDDDAIAQKDWIKNIILYLNKNPQAKIFGGPYDRYSTVPIPEWIPKEFGTKKISHREKKLIPKREWLDGSNIIIEKKLLKTLGGFNTDMGMKGNKIGYGEETEFQSRALKKHIDLFYSPKIKIKHLFDARKHNLRWMLKNTYISGSFAKRSLGDERTTIQRLFDLFKGIYYIFFWLLKPEKMNFKLRLFKSLEKIIYETGSFVSAIKKIEAY